MRTLFAFSLAALALCAPGSLRAEEGQASVVTEAVAVENKASGSANNAGLEEILLGVSSMRHGMVGVGTVELVEGILGLCAGRRAKRHSEINMVTVDRLGAAPFAGQAQSAGGSGAGAPASGLTNSQSATGAAEAGAGSLEAELVAAGGPKVREGLKLLEDRYGFHRDELLQALAGGKSVHDVLTTAPLNAFTEAELADAVQGARKDIKEAAKAGKLAAAPASASKGVASGPSGLLPAPDVAAEDAPLEPSKASPGSLRDAIARGLGEEDNAELSPEVKAALAAREASERAGSNPPKPESDMDLFEVIHLKYRERENNLRWGEPLKSAGL